MVYIYIYMDSHSLVERKKEEEDWKKKSLTTPSSSRAKAPLLFRPPQIQPKVYCVCVCVYIYTYT